MRGKMNAKAAVAEKEVPAKRRGRRRLETEEETLETVGSAAEAGVDEKAVVEGSPVKKRRGRKPTAKSEKSADVKTASEASASLKDAEEEPPVKKRRNRKTGIENAETTEDRIEATGNEGTTVEDALSKEQDDRKPAAEEKEPGVEEQRSVAEETPAKKRGGRKPAVKKDKAPAADVKPTLVLQFQDSEVDTNQLVESAIADFKSKKKRTPIKSLTLYLKPEDRAAYYVINETYNGKVDFDQA